MLPKRRLIPPHRFGLAHVAAELAYGRGAGVGRARGVGVARVPGAVAVGVAVAVAVGVAVGVGVGVGVAPDKQTGTFVIWPLVILKLPVAVLKVGFDTE